MSRRWIAMLIPWLVLLPLGLAGRATQAAPDSVFAVNSIADVNDAGVGDGVCETSPGNGICTLRAAIQEASANANPDTITVPAGTYALGRIGYDDSGVNGDLDVTGTVTITGAGQDSTIIDAGATFDRVFHIHGGAVTIAGLTIRNGAADNNGGGGGGIFIMFEGTLTLSNSIVTGNRATSESPYGGGIANYGSLTLVHSMVSSNTVSSASIGALGAGIFSFSDFLVLFDSVVSGNISTGYGGGLFSYDREVEITHSTINSNRARFGAGIAYSCVGCTLKSGHLVLLNSTISGNEAAVSGGGIYLDSGHLELYNVTVTDNFANIEENGDAYGGGIAQGPDGMLTFVNSILAGNFRVEWSDPFPLQDDSDCSGTIFSLGPNFVSATSHPCTIVGVPPLTGGFALLGPLADNGGPTPTHALLPGSPAIDAGTQPHCTYPLGAPLTRDQRGTRRPLFGEHSRRCDLGAFEFVAPLFLPLVRR